MVDRKQPVPVPRHRRLAAAAVARELQLIEALPLTTIEYISDLPIETAPSEAASCDATRELALEAVRRAFECYGFAAALAAQELKAH